MKLKSLFLLPLLLAAWWPGQVQAQGPLDVTIDWQELKTEKFTIVYADEIIVANRPVDCLCGVVEAEYYAAFIDDIYADLAAIFKTELDSNVNLRLFPTEQSYYQVNPIAERLPGVIAHALNSREEIAVALPRTTTLSEEELVNNIRHEMTHVFASYLSDGKLTAGFQEGIAQYLEVPTDQANLEPTLLEQAVEQDRLLTWAELDQAGQVYSDPQVAYPQSLSMVSFLVDRYGLATFLTFLQEAARQPGYRSALEVAYGESADQLEAEWLDYLPAYFESRWQVNAIYAYDLTDVTALVEKAAYTDAEARLTEIVTLLEDTNQMETLAQAEALLAKARRGQAAGALADEARAALVADNYALAIERGRAAEAAYEDLAYRERIPEIQNYIYRAEVGRAALNQLQGGVQMLDSLRFFEAERNLQEATALLQALGNEPASDQGASLLNESAWRQRLIMIGLIAVSGLLLFFNTLRRLFNRFLAGPLEVEFTA